MRFFRRSGGVGLTHRISYRLEASIKVNQIYRDRGMRHQCLVCVRRITLTLLIALAATIYNLGCDSDNGVKKSRGGADASSDSDADGADGTPSGVIELKDENNYRFQNALTIPSVETVSAEAVEICWDELTQDIRCHDLDPANDIDSISLVRFRNLSKAEIEENLSSGDLSQSNVDGYLGFDNENAATCASLSEFTLFGTKVDISEEYLQSDERVYMLLFSTGTVPGVASRMLTFITPATASANTKVNIPSGCGVLDFEADLTSLNPVPIPANGPFKIDWRALTRDGQGGAFEAATIDRVMLGFYAGETAASLQEKVLDLELIATSIWEIDYSGGSLADLSDATNRDGAFVRFEGDGTWLLGLMNTQGQNPAPLFLTVLEPYQSRRPDTADRDASDSDRPDASDAETPVISNLEAEVSDAVATVVTVRWTTQTPSSGYVAFGLTDVLGNRTPIENDAVIEHEALLLGLVAGTEYHFKVVLSEDDGGYESPIQSVTTGSLPLELPVLTAEGNGHDLFAVVPILGATTAVTIINPEGEIVWYRIDNRDLDIYRARLSQDGKSVLYNAASVSGDPADDSEIVRVSLDGKAVKRVPIPLLAHDFVEHDDGTLGVIATEYREFEGANLRGDKIVEVAPNGSITTVWTSWDCFDPAIDAGDDMEHGWTFANALDFDPVESVYYLGMRNLSSIAKIDRDSGTCLWVFGSTAATIPFAQGASRFLHQHQFQVLGDAILIFDNDGSPGTASRVIEYELDLAGLQASEVWRYSATPSLFTFVLGEPTRLDDGDTFVNWSVAGQMERVTPDGTRSWRVNSPLGYAFGYNTLERSLYRE
jgi:hypothetical protein